MEFLFAHSGLAIGLLGAGLAACLAGAGSGVGAGVGSGAGVGIGSGVGVGSPMINPSLLKICIKIKPFNVMPGTLFFQSQLIGILHKKSTA